MTKGVRLEDLDPKTQDRIIGSLHEQGLVRGDLLPKPMPRKSNNKKAEKRSWYMQVCKILSYCLGYTCFGLGWCLEYTGYYIKRLGEELRKIAQGI